MSLALDATMMPQLVIDWRVHRDICVEVFDKRSKIANTEVYAS